MRPNRSVEMPPTNAGRGAEPRHADGDIEARTADHRHDGIAPVGGLHGQKVDQGISAAQQHGLDLPSGSAIGCDPAHRIAAFPIQLAHQSMDLPLRAVKVGHSRRGRLALPADRRHRGHGLADRSDSCRPRPRPAWPRRAGPAPGFREAPPSGPVVSAMICRTSELRPAPPPITIRLLSTPCDRKTSTTSARP